MIFSSVAAPVQVPMETRYRPILEVTVVRSSDLSQRSDLHNDQRLILCSEFGSP